MLIRLVAEMAMFDTNWPGRAAFFFKHRFSGSVGQNAFVKLEVLGVALGKKALQCHWHVIIYFLQPEKCDVKRKFADL